MSTTVSTVIPPIKTVTNPPVLIPENNICESHNFGAKTKNFLECFLFKLPFFLQDIGMGYICIGLCLIVILISIFGKIKESYKWFILNQAFWDLFVSYDFICARPNAADWISPFIRIGGNIWTATKDLVQPNCFYSSELKFTRFLTDIVNTEACYMLFLLSFSRFLALYFYNFYGRNSTPIKSIISVVIFDIFFIVCVNLKNTYLAIYTDGDTISQILTVVEYFIVLLVVPISLIFTICVLAKIIKQLKFQKQQQSNPQRRANVRIAGVLVFQCLTLIILFAFTSVYDFPYSIIPAFNVAILKLPLRLQLPPILIKALKNNQKCFNVIRIFIDSIVILIVLSGYRKSILGIFEKIFMPWKKSPIENSTRVTAVSRNAVQNSHHR